ncbi:MAG: PilT/PilU family type 4a pilus ATPase [Dehalococcoidia bacterium]|nr:PilT/PilU family type 4a pilus ATPase [Dehalococcoidia bacterium]
MNIDSMLQLACDRHASDLHLVAGRCPVLRIDGRLVDVECEPGLPEDIALALSSISNEEQRKAFDAEMELDFAYSLPDGRRFRVNAGRHMGSACLVFRVIRGTPPSIEEMGLPEICRDLVHKRNGLVLLTGPTGSGKSTTLAAMIEYLNRTKRYKVITIEDPIEYVYSNGTCLISQREVGFDTHSFAVALKQSLRQDPNVILVGELRDMETASMVLMAAETGHLVLSTGHSPSAPLAVERVVDLFPTHQQALAQTRLASVLQGVLCQLLVPRVGGTGRVAAVEVMLANGAVKNLIREGKMHQLRNVIRTSQQIGMCTMDDALLRLYNARLVDKDEVLSRCVDVDEVTRMLRESRVPAHAAAQSP